MKTNRTALGLLTGYALAITGLCALLLPFARQSKDKPRLVPDLSPASVVSPAPVRPALKRQVPVRPGTDIPEVYGVDPRGMLLYSERQLGTQEGERLRREVQEMLRKTLEPPPNPPSRPR